MTKPCLEPIVTVLAGSFLLTGCWPFDNDNAAPADTPSGNEPPTISLTNTTTTLLEDTDTGSAVHVARIVIADDASGTNTISISGSDSALFEIVGSELRLMAGVDLDFETNPSLDVTVEVDDAAIGSTPDDMARMSISITDVNESPTISLTNTTTTIDEDTNTVSAIHVADIVITDDTSGTNTLSISGSDAALFEIVGSELRLTAGTGLNFETKATLDVTVEVDDMAIGSIPDDTVPMSISIIDINEPPTISLANATTKFAEDIDTGSAVHVADIVIIDDALGTNTLAISGSDAALFEIVGSELRLMAGTSLDFETNPSLDVTIEVDDMSIGLMPDDTVPTTISITDVIEVLNFLDGQDASVVIGQADFLSEGHNQDGFVTGNSFDYTYGNARFGNGVLYLPDYYNYRVLGFSGVPTVNNQAADFVLGQNAFTTTDEETGAGGMDCPVNLGYANNKLLVVDCSYSRAAIYNPAPTMGPGGATIAVGQANFFDDGSACTQTSLSFPEAGTMTVDGRVIIADSDNNRVMIWNSNSVTSGAPADLVLGQSDFTSCDDNAPNSQPSNQNFDHPSGVWSDGEKLVVLDYYNHRAMIWTSFPTSNGQDADLVLGQGDFTHNAYNDDDQDNIANVAPTARTLSYPDLGVDFSGLQLCIADSENSRVLIWDGFPENNFQPADRVLGQADFLSGVYDRGGSIAANTLDQPTGCLFLGRQLIISDTENSRFLVYDEAAP
jgi:hypothetical protein